jgi:septum site-determining protein MinD
VLAASQTRDKDALTKEGVQKCSTTWRDGFDYIVCDSPAGIEKGASWRCISPTRRWSWSTRSLLGARLRPHPRPARLQDPPRRERRARQGTPAADPLQPQARGTGEMLSVGDVEEILGLKSVGVIPESGDVLNASNKGEPVILEAESDAARPTTTRWRACSATPPMRFTTVEKKGFFSKIFGG